MQRLLYITHRIALAAFLLLLLALAPAMAQSVMYQGQTGTLAVVQVPGETYSWDIYDDPTVNFATVSGNCPATSAIFAGGNMGSSVSVKWLKSGFYFYKVTARSPGGCTMNLKIGRVEVKEPLPTAVLTLPDPICVGEFATIEVALTGTGPWDMTYTDGTKTWDVKGIVDPISSIKVTAKVPGANFWVTEVTDKFGINTEPSDKVWLEVKPKPISSKIYQFVP